DLDVREPCIGDEPNELTLPERALEAELRKRAAQEPKVDECRSLLADRNGRNVSTQEHVRIAQRQRGNREEHSAAGLEHARHLGDRTIRVVEVLDDATGVHEVERAVGKANVADVAEDEVAVDSISAERLLCRLDRVRREVDARNVSPGPSEIQRVCRRTTSRFE